MTRHTPIKAFAPLWIALLALLTSACAGGQIALPNDLKIGIQTDYPPLAFERDGRVVGIEADLARKVGEALDRRVRFVVLDRRELLRAVEEGDVDVVMAGLSVTQTRAKRVRFIEPYVDVGQMAILRRDRIGELGSIDKLKTPGRSVGFVRGTTGEQYVRGVLTSSVPASYGSVEEGTQALRENKVDYFIHDAPTAWRLGMDPGESVLFGLYRPLTREQLAWAVRIGNNELASQLDGYVRAWRASGEIDSIVTNWVPVRVTQ